MTDQEILIWYENLESATCNTNQPEDAICCKVRDLIASAEEATVLAAADILKKEVKHHRTQSGPHDFCDSYGCFSLEDLENAIRALLKTPGQLARREQEAYDRGYQDGQRDLHESNPGPEAI